MNASGTISRRLGSAPLILAAALVVCEAAAGPGDSIERHPVPASTVFRFSDGDPSVASDTDGDFVVVWASIQTFDVDLDEGIWGRRFRRDGTPIGPQFRVSPPDLDPALRDESPVVAIDSDGDFVVAWFQNDFSSARRPQIRAQRFDRAGQPVGTVFTVNDALSAPTGNALAAAMDADGDFVLVWAGRAPDHNRIGSFAQRYDAAGVPQGPVFRVDQAAGPAFFAFPTVAMNAQGNFAIIWLQSLEAAPATVQGRLFGTDGGALGAEFTVAASGTTLLAGNVVAAMDAKGNFVVAFGRHVEGGPFGSESVGVFARRFNALAKPRGREFLVSRPGHVQSRSVGGADMDADGDFVLTWSGNESTQGGPPVLSLRLFSASGIPLTNERRFDFPELGPMPPTQPDVAMDARGNYISVWQQSGENPDGSGSGDNIFVRRYAGPADTRVGCAGFLATKTGSNSHDIIVGTPQDDTIHALGGHDTVQGGGGEDIVCGGRGNDQLFGEGGNDRLFGGPGDDFLDGGAGSDACDGDQHVNADAARSCETVTNVP